MHLQCPLHIERQIRRRVAFSRLPISLPVAICRKTGRMALRRATGKGGTVRTVNLKHGLHTAGSETHVRARKHLDRLAFLIFRRTRKFKLHPGGFQSGRRGLHHRTACIIRPQCHGSLAVRNPYVAVGRERDGTPGRELSRTGNDGKRHIRTIA